MCTLEARLPSDCSPCSLLGWEDWAGREADRTEGEAGVEEKKCCAGLTGSILPLACHRIQERN